MAKPKRHQIKFLIPKITTRRFLWLAALFGILYAILIPPFQAPDEVHHLYRVQHIVQGQIIGLAPVQGEQRLGGYIPKHYQEIAHTFRQLRYAYNERITLDSLIHHLGITKESNKTFLDFPNVGYYPALSYCYPALVATLLHPLQLNGLIELYLLRISSILFWILIISWCIRIYPDSTNIWLLVGTLPAALFTHAGLSTDIMTHGLVWIFLAMVFRNMTSETKINQNLGFIILTWAAIVYIRPVFAPFVLLLLLFPWYPRKYFYIFCCLVLTGTILYFQYNMLGDRFIPYDAYNEAFRENVQLNPGVNPQEQLQWIRAHPIHYIKVLIISWISSLPSTFGHYLGKFGWEKNYLPTSILIGLFVGLIWTSLNTTTHFTKKARIVLLSIAIITTIVVSTALYMQWEPVGGPNMHSLSGRYFVGIFPLIWLAISGLHSRPDHKLTSIKWFWIFAWGTGIASVYLRYYLT